MKYLDQVKEYLSTYKLIIYLIGYIIVIGLLCTNLWFINSKPKACITNTTKPVIKQASIIKDQVSVDIKGAITNPGVYALDTGSHVIDAINQAGGLTSNADTSLINLSKKLTDEMAIIIYTKEEIKKGINSNNGRLIDKTCTCPTINNDSCLNPISSSKSTTATGLVNINTADATQLSTLSGIGPSKAGDIINYRNTTKFAQIEDLKNVSGIGEATFAKIKDFITI